MADTHVISFTMVAVFFKDAINQLQRGENSYKSGYVKNMLFNKEVKPALLKGTVNASMKKNTYSVEVTIDVEDEVILHATCTCPRGLVKCHHMASLCIYAHHNVSITDQECAWAAPRASNIQKYPQPSTTTLTTTAVSSSVPGLSYMLE
ncbi:hypothetical protein FQR65_LT13847 [Abscondita terminalis]|nr:hypothetical protein FQR65_LT13847 [Abscondita terminalis]